MTEYIISLDVETSLSVTAVEVSALLGVNKSEIDSRRLRKRKRILWRYEPVFRENVKLLTRIKKLASQLNIKEPIRKGRRIKAIYFSIGVFHEIDCFDCTISLPYRSLALLAAKIPDLDIVISTYPVDSALEE